MYLLYDIFQITACLQLSDVAGWNTSKYLLLTRPQLVVLFYTYQPLQSQYFTFAPNFDDLYWISIMVSNNTNVSKL